MPGKGKKAGSKKSTGKNGNGAAADGKSSGAGGKSKSSKKTSRGSRRGGGKAPMENAYYTCHNIMDVLYCRGFPWPDAQKKKRKGKK
ncbi:unnamed protein product [Trichogramma brassicae]|uniref:Small lysine-rich protein 1 n=1 Tax=Trichogramma brassicae TaxID=86971 RepID=A0A6H5I0P3_9HYME|nr:unnamed protein product [Trichogramma brassicae]